MVFYLTRFVVSQDMLAQQFSTNMESFLCVLVVNVHDDGFKVQVFEIYSVICLCEKIVTLWFQFSYFS